MEEKEYVIDQYNKKIYIDDIKDVLITIPYQEYIHYGVVVQQLQAYKDREDKLREYVKENVLWLDSLDNQVYTIYGYNTDRTAIIESDYILQILNKEER